MPALGTGSGTVLQQGTHASRPAAATALTGVYYYETDTNGGTLYQCTGAAWVQMAACVNAAVVKLAEVVLGSNTASMDFTSIPQTYRSLELKLYGRNTTSDYTLMQFNGDTGANYDTSLTVGNSSTITAGGEAGVVRINLGLSASWPSDTSMGGSILVEIPGYSGTTFEKDGFFQSGEINARSVGNLYVRHGHFFWRSTVAITSIHLFQNSGLLVAGTVASLYGIL